MVSVIVGVVSVQYDVSVSVDRWWVGGTFNVSPYFPSCLNNVIPVNSVSELQKQSQRLARLSKAL